MKPSNIEIWKQKMTDHAVKVYGNTPTEEQLDTLFKSVKSQCDDEQMDMLEIRVEILEQAFMKLLGDGGALESLSDRIAFLSTMFEIATGGSDNVANLH